MICFMIWQLQASVQRDSFVMVTNLAPCAGVRVHLWPDRDTLSNTEQAVSHRIKEMTLKFVQLPAATTPIQVRPSYLLVTLDLGHRMGEWKHIELHL